MSRQRIGEIAGTLLDYVENNRTFQAERMMRVPAASYSDPELWAAEMTLIYKRLPLMLALSCELPKPGDYKTLEIVGYPLLLVRDRSETVRAFLNVCAHRWAPVASGERGNCAHGRFVCPFHGWTYGLDGKLLSVSDRAKFGEVDRTILGLKQLPCEERHGMIFVRLLAGRALDLDEYYGALLQEYAEFRLESWTYLGKTRIEGPNWKLIWTNFFESYHVAAQHPQTVGLRWISNVSHYEGFGPSLRVGFAERTIRNLRDVPREQWSEYEGRGFSFMRYLFPNAIASMYPSEISLFTQLFPGPTPERTQVVILYFRKEPVKDEADRQRVEGELARMNEQGVAVLQREDFATAVATQRSLCTAAHDGFLYGLNERGPQYFHEWVNWYLEDNAELPKPVL